MSIWSKWPKFFILQSVFRSSWYVGWWKSVFSTHSWAVDCANLTIFNTLATFTINTIRICHLFRIFPLYKLLLMLLADISIHRFLWTIINGHFKLKPGNWCWDSSYFLIFLILINNRLTILSLDILMSAVSIIIFLACYHCFIIHWWRSLFLRFVLYYMYLAVVPASIFLKLLWNRLHMVLYLLFVFLVISSWVSF